MSGRPPNSVPPTVEAPPIPPTEEVNPPTTTTTNVVTEPVVVSNEAARTCNRACIPFEIYHTNETGNWEIFRVDHVVDGIPVRTNLSHGVGDDMLQAFHLKGIGLYLRVTETALTIPRTGKSTLHQLAVIQIVCSG